MPAYTIKPLVTATAINTGGRNGHSETTDHSVSVDLSVRKEMGGPGLPNTTTPEHLFAAGYAACFGGALEFVAHQRKKDVTGTVVTCATLGRPARRRRVRHRRQNARQGSDAFGGGGAPARRRDTRKNLPLQPCDARQYRFRA